MQKSIRQQDVLYFINMVKLTFGKYKEMSGGCYKFHLILKHIFNGEGYYNSDHVITKIGDHFYDVTGEVNLTDDFIEIDKFGYEFMNESFKQHL